MKNAESPNKTMSLHTLVSFGGSAILQTEKALQVSP
jgi:hypothetical protein